MKTTLALISSSIILAGCSSTIQVRIDEPLNNDRVFNYDQVNSRVDGSPGTVVCVDGTTYEVNGVYVAKDSTVFTETGLGIRHVIPTHDLLNIKHKNYGAGAFSGGLLGSLAGLTTGIVILVFQNDHSPDSGMGAFVLILGPIGGGAFVGAVIGSLEGSTQEFQFQASQSRKQTSPERRMGDVSP